MIIDFSASEGNAPRVISGGGRLPDLAAEVERVVRSDSADAFDAIFTMIDSAHITIRAASAALDTGATGAFDFWASLGSPPNWVIAGPTTTFWRRC
jgi:hypothetical protein